MDLFSANPLESLELSTCAIAAAVLYLVNVWMCANIADRKGYSPWWAALTALFLGYLMLIYYIALPDLELQTAVKDLVKHLKQGVG